MTGANKYQEIEKKQATKTRQYINDVLANLPEQELLQSFAAHYLQSMVLRVLQSFSHQELAEFVQARFELFQEILQSQTGKFTITNPKGNNKTIIEIAYPDAAHLVATIESLFQEFKIRVTFRVHSLMSVKKNGTGAYASVLPPEPTGDRVVIIYFEIDEIEDEAVLDQLRARLDTHLCAIEVATRDREQVIEKMRSLKPLVAKTTAPLPEPREEWQKLLDWLENLNFSFFGYIAFPTGSSQTELEPVLNSGLGILSDTYLKKDLFQLLSVLKSISWRFCDSPSPFAFDTIKVKSPVKRFEHLMRLSLKLLNEKGELIEHVILGLIKRSSLQTKSSDVPLIHYKMMYIFEKKKFLFDSHNYNQVVRIFSTVPQFELFRTPAETLLQIANNILSITDNNDIYCFARNDFEKNTIFLMVAIPNELFNHDNITSIIKYLKSQAPYSDYEVVEVLGVSICRLHIYFDLLGDGNWTPNTTILEQDISELVKSWDAKVQQCLYEQHPSGLSEQLYRRYIPVMPPHYRIRTAPVEAVRDILILEKMAHGKGIEFDLAPFQSPESDLSGSVSLLYLYSRDKIDLIQTMPVLQNLGLYVVDQLTARIGDKQVTYGYIQSYRIRDKNQHPLDIKRYKTLITDLLTAVFEGKTENDPLNALTILADLPWRAINVLQLYRNLYLQVGSAYTKEKINRALKHYPNHARSLFEYFEVRFSPDNHHGNLEYRKEVLLPKKRKAFIESLRKVNEVVEDVIFRHLFELVENTLRTNYFIPKTTGDTFISIKLDSRKVKEMPVPVPFREIYVHDVGMEGTHLRFGTVARGGLRWSDRVDDFRTEILGLVKTQQTKNVVIVPVGSKGGFIIKKSVKSREEAAQESQKQYKKFISGLLDITDNMDANRKPKHPHHVLAYDQLDPYLVVAADKGTATFSDTANAISSQYKFWLDDAFASGGSVGYDHKKEGITARGAWECVKIHFKEMGKDIQSEVTTVAGVGDMSGDVFGNGMLLSKCLKLRAAFNHMHIFLDPDPDPQASWEERQRLFKLPRSTWRDYNKNLISQGGGVFDRNAKEVPLSPEVQAMLGVDVDVLSGEKMIRTILRMQTELLWFGGIGTYIKSDQESHFQVGDQANDAVRINVSDCQASVIGEGANLGMTQLGRIDFASKGAINTDAVDNSAGVNMSDYEVNIKILLQQMLQQGELESVEERNALLAQATDEVSELVLGNNRRQHRLLSMDGIRSIDHFRIFKHLIRYLITEKGLDAKSEFIPSRGQLEKMDEAKGHLSRPVLAVLQAYVKMWVYNSLLESEMLNDPYLEPIYRDYFPQTIRQRFGDKISKHPLRREIIGTVLTNKLVNQAGITFFYRMEQLSAKTIDQITMAYLIFDECLDGPNFRYMILYTEGVSEFEKYTALISFENIIQLLAQSLLQLSGKSVSFDMINKYKGLFDDLRDSLADSQEVIEARAHWEEKGFSEEVAKIIGLSTELSVAPDVIYLHEQEQVSVPSAMWLTVQVNEAFAFHWLKHKLESIELETDWDQSHQDILLQSIEVHKLNLIRLLLRNHKEVKLHKLTSEELLEPISQQFAVPLSTYFQTLNHLKGGAPITLTTLSVCINRLNFLEIV